MYQNTPRILNNYEKDHFDPYIAQIAEGLTKNDPHASKGRSDSYTESYKDLLTQLLSSTPTVYYETLRKCFGLEIQENLDNFIRMENLPTDLSADLKARTPDAFLHFLQYIQEADVEVIHPEAAADYYDRTLSYLEAQRKIDEIMNEEEERISNEQYAENLGVPVSMLSSTIGAKAAGCAALSNAVSVMVKNRFGIEEFDPSVSQDPDAIAMYEETMREISQLPSVCYGMLHAIATGRNIPSFYDTRGVEYEDGNDTIHNGGFRHDEEYLADPFFLALNNAKDGSFRVKDPTAAKQYYERYASLEPPRRVTPRSAETVDKRVKEAVEDAEKQYKLETAEKAAAKKEGMAKFNDFLSRLNHLGRLTKAEYDFLSTQAKIYAKENEMLDKASQKYEKAAHALELLRVVEDIRDLTPKEQKALEKATKALNKAETELNSVKDTLIERNRQRSTVGADKFPEHAQLREEQIRLGDTTYVPLHTREDSINQGMYGYRAHLYREDRQRLLQPPRIETPAPTREESAATRTPLTDLTLRSTTRQTRLTERDAKDQERIHKVLQTDEQARIEDPHPEAGK